MILQLEPSLPVFVVAGTGCPTGKGRCFVLIDYGCEEFTLFKIAMDATGEIYDVPQSHVRFQNNMSLGRRGKTDEN